MKRDIGQTPFALAAHVVAGIFPTIRSGQLGDMSVAYIEEEGLCKSKSTNALKYSPCPTATEAL